MRKLNRNPSRLYSGRLPFTLKKEGRRVFFLCVLSLSLCTAVSAQTLRIAAAADLQNALTDLAAQYEKQTGAKLAITYGSSGNFFAQIQNGAPFDLFLSADLDYPKKLIQAGFAESSSLQIYASGRLALWLPPDSPLDPATGLKILLDPRVQKIAIANPEHAPYGRAAVAALRNAGLYDQLRTKLVFGENISQAAQFVQSGSAQAGLIALSLALSPAMKNGKRWDIPSDSYPPFEQAAVLLKSSPNQQAAASFLAFLKSPPARDIFERYGFRVPRDASPEQKP
ncbi:MAG TPA: molybdate ABC transporter substrate-binding protein [Candidatus Acidoferrales bacterium]|jgi:molybdate transport system substrate-binding protein|nr:molybdate ABC transporter substrate-binding protein [Candidatus Acidoferrales bacterium]